MVHGKLGCFRETPRDGFLLFPLMLSKTTAKQPFLVTYRKIERKREGRQDGERKRGRETGKTGEN